MFTLPEWSADYATAIVAILAFALVYAISRAVFGAATLRLILDKLGVRLAHPQAVSVHLERLLGAAFLLIASLALIAGYLPGGPADYGLAVGKLGPALVATVVLSPLAIVVLYFACRAPFMWKYYPEIERSDWHWRHWWANAASWFVYLIAYEFLLRGFLLFAVATTIDAWFAIALTSAFYSAIHLPKSAGEYLMSIPVGIVFGILTLQTGSILTALALHSVIAIGASTFCMLANPDIRFPVRDTAAGST